jgi:hypothetical protein
MINRAACKKPEFLDMKKNLLAAVQFTTPIGDIGMTTYLPADCLTFAH